MRSAHLGGESSLFYMRIMYIMLNRNYQYDWGRLVCNSCEMWIDRILCGSFGERSGGQEQVALLNDKPLRALPRRISIRQRMCFRSRGPPPLRTPLIKHAIRVALGPSGVRRVLVSTVPINPSPVHLYLRPSRTWPVDSLKISGDTPLTAARLTQWK